MNLIGLKLLKLIKDLSVTLTPSQHWNKRSILPFGPGATDKALWGSFLINYKGKKFFLHVILVIRIFTK